MNTGAIPPPLAPSVEEAYRRKCIQLKQRINEVDHDNDAARVRVVRVERGVQKLRLERAFLLEQLAKRTSTNVEDSEGSPSPPPTPKEKPLRTKRGHRKPSFLANLGEASAGSTFIQQGPVTLSPSSDAFSHTLPESTAVRNSTPQAVASKRLLATNGVATIASGPASTPPRKIKSAFDSYCNESRSLLQTNNRRALADGTFDIEEALARGWRDLGEEQKLEHQKRYDEVKKSVSNEKSSGPAPAAPKQTVFDSESRPASTAPTADEPDEDVEMADDGDEPPQAAAAEAGFTAVNRG
ncbi:putative HMG box-containing protein C10F6.08c [Amylocarpus encephaloides]|uniref:HMG box-containing protein C10F6.08c n=1 Tax=Amylocarpus encephaloides TaxID=45428 RepID=A0A9P7YNW9_9HELO|nr:putative HMG box-containing protein C10F6.08c [Amylocarpus encephaloides]